MAAVRRVLLNALWTLSLLLSLAAAAVWGRSYFRRDVVSTQWGRRTVNLFSDCGSCVVFVQLYPVDYGHSWGWEAAPVERDAATVAKGLTGFEVTTRSPLWRTNPPLHVVVPHWTVPAVFGVLPVTVHMFRRRRRHRAGLCPSCGYDLRATPGRCPECGQVTCAATIG